MDPTSRYRRVLERVDSADVLKVLYDDGELRIEGCDRSGSRVVELRFQDVLLTRVSDEGGRLRLIKELRLLQESGVEPALVLADEQSELIGWVAEEGLQTRDTRDAKHFVVLIGREVVDVVSFENPVISARS